MISAKLDTEACRLLSSGGLQCWIRGGIPSELRVVHVLIDVYATISPLIAMKSISFGLSQTLSTVMFSNKI